MAKKKISHINEEFDLKLFAIIVKKYFYLLLAILFLALVGSLLYLRYTHPVYQSESVIKIGTVNNANAVLNIQNPQFYDAMGMGSNNLAGSIELLRSKLMVSRVLNQMPLDISYFAQGNVLDYEMYRQTPFEISFLLTDSTFYGVQVFVNFLSETRFQMHYKFNNTVSTGIYNVEQWYNSPGLKFKLRIIEYNFILEQQKKIKQDPFYFLINNPESLIDKYYKNMSIILTNQFAQTVKISFKDRNPQKAADFVNTMASEYDLYVKENKSAGANKSIEFINETLSSIETELKDSEKKLELFKRANKITQPTQNAEDVLDHINGLIDQRTEFLLNTAVLNRLEKEIKGNKAVDQLVPLLAGTVTDDLIKEMVIRIQTMEDRKANMQFQATEANAAMIALEKDIVRQREMLINSIINSRKSISEKIKSIDDRIMEFEGDFASLPSKEAEMARLDRLYQVNQKFYQLLLEKKIEFSISRAGIVTDNIILQQGTAPFSPITPNRKLILAGSLLAGFVFSFLLIFIRYLFYNEITSLEEINQYTDAAMLGIIPKYKSQIPVSQLLVDKNPKSAISESFRSVRT
ncbi:MAG TPA: GNVR domain-containing protein, partial [Bacteroidia bacterium]|nr:GNVR domain-containing protein [Bacteroidia bacterium]